jgi:hypothetical protein
VSFVVALLSSLRRRVYVALVVAEVSFVYPGLLPVYLVYPLHVRAFAIVVAVRVRGRCAPSPSIHALSRTRSAHIS